MFAESAVENITFQFVNLKRKMITLKLQFHMLNHAEQFYCKLPGVAFWI